VSVPVFFAFQIKEKEGEKKKLNPSVCGLEDCNLTAERSIVFNAVVKVDFLEVERILVVILIEKIGDGFWGIVAKGGSKIVGCSHVVRDCFEWDVFAIMRENT